MESVNAGLNANKDKNKAVAGKFRLSAYVHDRQAKYVSQLRK